MIGPPLRFDGLGDSQRQWPLYCGGLGIREYNLNTGQPTDVDLTENGSGVSDLAVMDDDGELVAFGGFSPTVAHWRLDGGGPIAYRLTGVKMGSTASCRAEISWSGHPWIWMLSTPSRAQSSIIWAVSASLTPHQPGRRFSVCEASPGAVLVHLAVGACDSSFASDVVVYDIGTKRDRLKVRLPAGDLGVSAVSPNNEWAMFAIVNNTGLDLWRLDIAKGQFNDPVAHVVQTANNSGDLDRSYTGEITNDGRTVFLGYSNDVHAYDATTGNEIAAPLPNNFNPFVTDKYLLSTELSNGVTIVVRDLADLTVVATMGIGSNPFHYAASTDGSILQVLTVDTDGNVLVALYDLDTFTPIGEALHVAPYPTSGDISPDGLAMAIDVAGATSIWDLDADHWMTPPARSPAGTSPGGNGIRTCPGRARTARPVQAAETPRQAPRLERLQTNCNTWVSFADDPQMPRSTVGACPQPNFLPRPSPTRRGRSHRNTTAPSPGSQPCSGCRC